VKKRIAFEKYLKRNQLNTAQKKVKWQKRLTKFGHKTQFYGYKFKHAERLVKLVTNGFPVGLKGLLGKGKNVWTKRFLV
jgi:hypothetical protein